MSMLSPPVHYPTPFPVTPCLMNFILAPGHFISPNKCVDFSPLGLCICCFLRVEGFSISCHLAAFRSQLDSLSVTASESSVDFLERGSTPTCLGLLCYSDHYVSFTGHAVARKCFFSAPPLDCTLHGTLSVFCLVLHPESSYSPTHSFARAAITKYPRLGSYTTHVLMLKFISSQLWKLDV